MINLIERLHFLQGLENVDVLFDHAQLDAVIQRQSIVSRQHLIRRSPLGTILL